MVDSIENELIIITKQTYDAFLTAESPSDAIALYSFYYYTAKWQKTNQPKCNTQYAAKGLKWSDARVRRAKKDLMNLGLVEDIQQKCNGKIVGCYIKLNYVIKQVTLDNHPNDFPYSGFESDFHPNDFPHGGSPHSVANLETNALSVNKLNALSANNKNALSSLNREDKQSENVFENRSKRKRYGEYDHVVLTEEQYGKLVDDYGKETAGKYIQRVDEYCQMHGKSYKDYNLTIRNWMNRDGVRPHMTAELLNQLGDFD